MKHPKLFAKLASQGQRIKNAKVRVVSGWFQVVSGWCGWSPVIRLVSNGFRWFTVLVVILLYVMTALIEITQKLQMDNGSSFSD